MTLRYAVVCDKIDELKDYCTRRDNGQPILCLTKNPEIIDYVLQNKKNITVKYLEASKTYLDYAETTLKIIDSINKKIENVCKEEYKYLYLLGCSMDMGDISKRILDAVMIRDMLNGILNSFEIAHMECYYHEYYASEIEAIFFWKKTRKCVLKFVCKGDVGSSRGRLYLLTRCGSKVVTLLATLNAQRHYLRCFLNTGGKKGTEVSSDVGIVQYGGKQKNYNWSIGYLKELEMAGISFHIIGINDVVAGQWRKWGYASDSPVDYIDKKKVLKAYCNYRKEKTKLKRYLKKNLKYSPSELLDIEQLRIILKAHLDYNAFDAVVLDSGAEEYFKTHDFKIIDLNATTNYMMSKICYFNVSKNNNKTKFKAGSGNLSIMAKGIGREPFGFIRDFGFVLEEKKSHTRNEPESSLKRKYVIKNTAYTDEFYSDVAENNILSERLNVIWAPSYPALGVTHFSSFEKTGMSVLDFFSRNDTASLYVKFHPNQMQQEIRRFYQKYENCKNIQFKDNKVNIKDIFEQVEIVVTNCSLTIIDAAVRKKAVICVVDKTEYQLVKQHEEGIYIITNIDDLLKLLKSLQEDSEYRKQWITSCINKQNTYFSRFIADKDSKDERMKAMKIELGWK